MVNSPSRISLRMGGTALGLALALAACTPAPSKRAEVDIRGSDPNGTSARPAPTRPTGTAPSAGTSGEIIDNGDYRSVIARDGDTVQTLAGRAGLSASELGAYNGLPPNHRLRKGDELILPPRTATATASRPAPAPVTAPIEATPLDGAPAATDPVDGLPADGTELAAAPTDAPAPSAPPSGWSPDIAAAAIERAGKTEPSGTPGDAGIGRPPSAADPVPPEPAPGRDLNSPDLDQYRTEASGPNAKPPADPKPAPPEPRVAAADPAPAADRGPVVKLRRPVKGKIAVGFRKGSGPTRNDGVDFAAPAGAPVVAAEAGEVALVSESLGGLGTIVLIRHQDELLTVYGRIDGVSVKKGDIVNRGQRIGVVSAAAAPAEPRMHFEVRRGATVLDPTKFL